MNVKTDKGYKQYRSVSWEDGKAKLINQWILPHKWEICELSSPLDASNAIIERKVRGAPAIGITAAFGMALACITFRNKSRTDFFKLITESAETLRSSRPTTFDLVHAVDVVTREIELCSTPDQAMQTAIDVATNYAEGVIRGCEQIGQHGQKILSEKANVLTHCNAGWLACGDWGTATAPIYVAARRGKRLFVFVNETRPRCQGAKLTAWELLQESIDFCIIPGSPGYLMQQGRIDVVITGADRIALNGDVANQIGTYDIAVLAKENGIPFYVAAPFSTFDLNSTSGKEIPIEHRTERDVLFCSGLSKSGEIEEVRIAPIGSKAENPVFDVTPAKYVTGFITPSGIMKAEGASIKEMLKYW